MTSIWKQLKNWRVFNQNNRKQPPIWSPLEFKSGGFLTLGAEIELQIIDPATGKLVPRADELLQKCADLKSLHQEFYKSTLEIVTGKCTNAIEIENDLKTSIARLNESADELGVTFATTGCHPFAIATECEISNTPRYKELIDRNQWLTRQMTVYGLHVHIGMRSGDEAIRFCNFFLRFVPHLLALSASSPFVQGHDTGLSSFRPTTYEALPTAGMPYVSNSWQEFNQLCANLAHAGAIESLKDLWWDIRPSPNYGTLEIRICDGLATLSETAALVAFIHSLAAWFSDHGSWLEQVARPPHWLMRENKWRAMRKGLNASFITNTTGDTKTLKEELLEWFDRLVPYMHRYGYGRYFDQLRAIVEQGNSADRQRVIYHATGSMQEVVAFNIAEFKAQIPLPVPDVEELALKKAG